MKDASFPPERTAMTGLVATVTASDSLLHELAAMVSEELNAEIPALDADLISAGILDSLGVVNLLVLFEDRYGLSIAPDDLELAQFRSVESMARFIAERVRMKASQSETRLSGHPAEDSHGGEKP